MRLCGNLQVLEKLCLLIIFIASHTCCACCKQTCYPIPCLSCMWMCVHSLTVASFYGIVTLKARKDGMEL
jgi:hypothetical protein